MENRKIIHIDMDMFFAAIEIRDNPQLRNKPVVVGGKPTSRSVVATANYEARKYGIRSAMSSTEAYRRCPHCIFVPSNHKKYREVSEQIRAIFFQYTDLVEPLSCDEAFLDITESEIATATQAAQEIKQEIYNQTKLTASAGVSSNKFIAKIASDYNKPNGLCVVPPNKIIEFIYPLPVVKIPGVGKVTALKMKTLQLNQISDLAAKEITFLTDNFGKFGAFLFNISRGIDNRLVTPRRKRKSYGQETTFDHDVTDIEEIFSYLKKCCDKIVEALNAKDIQARTVTVKVKYHDFQTITRSTTLSSYITSSQQVYPLLKDLLKKTKAGQIPIRLAGVSLSQFNQDQLQQMEFHFD